MVCPTPAHHPCSHWSPDKRLRSQEHASMAYGHLPAHHLGRGATDISMSPIPTQAELLSPDGVTAGDPGPHGQARLRGSWLLSCRCVWATCIGVHQAPNMAYGISPSALRAPISRSVPRFVPRYKRVSMKQMTKMSSIELCSPRGGGTSTMFSLDHVPTLPGKHQFIRNLHCGILDRWHPCMTDTAQRIS